MSRVEVRVDNRIRIRASALDPETRRDLERAFTHKNPTHFRLKKQAERLRDGGGDRRMFGALLGKLKTEPEQISTWREEGPDVTFPRGGMQRVRQALQERCYLLAVHDEREEGDPILGKPPSEHRVTRRDFQSDVVTAVVRIEQGLVRSPQGSGKTTALLACIAECGVPSLVVVSTGALLEQWVKRARVELGLSANEVGVLDGKEHRIRPVTIGMQQTLWRHAAKYTSRFGLVAADEVHLFAAQTFQQVIDLFPARFRIGASAMEKRKDGKEFLLYDLFGHPIVEVDRDKLVDRGLVLDVEVRLVPLDTSVPWYEALPGEQRAMATMQLLGDLTEHQTRNEAIAELVAEELKRGEQVLAMAHRVEHCMRLRALFVQRDPRADGLLVGGGNAEFPRSLAGLQKGSCVAACGTYQAIGTGFDVPRVGRAVAATPIHTNRYLFEQVAGRVARTAPGKRDAAIYYPWDRALFGDAPLRNFLSWGKRVVVRDESGAWVDGREYLEREEGEDDAS